MDISKEELNSLRERLKAGEPEALHELESMQHRGELKRFYVDKRISPAHTGAGVLRVGMVPGIPAVTLTVSSGSEGKECLLPLEKFGTIMVAISNAWGSMVEALYMQDPHYLVWMDQAMYSGRPVVRYDEGTIRVGIPQSGLMGICTSAYMLRQMTMLINKFEWSNNQLNITDEESASVQEVLTMMTNVCVEGLAEDQQEDSENE